MTSGNTTRGVIFDLDGVQAGKAAGMTVVAVTTTRDRRELAKAQADRIVDSLAELTASDFRTLLRQTARAVE